MNAWEAFVDFWNTSELREQQGAQSHFNALCRLLAQNPARAASAAGTPL